MRKFLLYLYIFFIIYTPPFFDLYFGIPTQFISVGLLLITGGLLITIQKKKKWYLRADIMLLFTGIIISATYFLIRANIEGNDLRILQNLFVLVQITHIIVIVGFIKYLGLNKEESIKLLLNLAVFQSLLGILMIIIPEFKNLALQLYYLGREENIFISRMRIYGISGDYTFFTPIYHGILAFIATVLALVVRFKYIIYVPFIILIILLNGRYGLIVYFVGVIIFIIYLLLKGKVPKKIITFFGTCIVGFPPLVAIIYYKAPATYEWIAEGIKDTLIFIFEGELQGNYKSLAGTHVYFPEGLNFLVGAGHRVYSLEGTMRGYNASDIGYINDLFMGGLIYLCILYGIIIWFLMRKFKDLDIFVKAIIVSLVAMLLIANYKGEVMRGGTVLMGVILIVVILKDKVIKGWERDI